MTQLHDALLVITRVSVTKLIGCSARTAVQFSSVEIVCCERGLIADPRCKSNPLLQTFILIVISIPSHPHSFIPGLKPPFSAKHSHRSLSFLLPDWLHGFPGLLTVTSKHIRFLLVSFFFCFPVFSCRFRPVVVAWHSGRTSVSGRRTFSVLRSTCS